MSLIPEIDEEIDVDSPYSLYDSNNRKLKNLSDIVRQIQIKNLINKIKQEPVCIPFDKNYIPKNKEVIRNKLLSCENYRDKKCINSYVFRRRGDEFVDICEEVYATINDLKTMLYPPEYKIYDSYYENKDSSIKRKKRKSKKVKKRKSKKRKSKK
jgi:hypothetical protein